MNMFKSVPAKTVSEYLAMVPKERKKDINFLHQLIKKTVPKLKPHLAYNMLGYGSFPYENYKKEMVKWPVVALANQKNYISIYICALSKGKYLAEIHKADLGKVSVGKSCIRFKKIEDLNTKTLISILKLAEKSPGIVTPKSTKKI